MYTFLVLRVCVTELWIPASSVQKGYSEGPSLVYGVAEHVVCLEGPPGAPIPLYAHTSLLCLLLWPGMNSCSTSWLAGFVAHLRHHTRPGCAGNNGI